MTKYGGKLRDMLIQTGMESKDYFKLENHQFSKDNGLKSQAKSKPVAADPYETGKLENQVRKEGLKLLKDGGFIARTLYTGGIPTGGGQLAPNPAIGIADTLVAHPIKKLLFFVEWKRNSGGKLSPEQQTFIWDVTQCNIDVFVVTSATMLEMKLKEKGYLTIS